MPFSLRTVGLLVVLLLFALPSPLRAAEQEGRFLVVAPAGLEAPLAEFLEYKRRQLPTEFRALETILAESTGRDDPEKLKTYLYQQFKEHHLRYVLLVGDIDVMPVRYITLDRKDPKAFNYAFYPSDLYYSDLVDSQGEFDDWNGQTEGHHAGYFGEVRGEYNKEDPINFDGVDYHPDVAVGRWPISTPDEVRVVARKSMAYEERTLDTSNGAHRRAALVSVGGWVDTRTYLQRLSRQLDSTWSIERRYFADARRDYQTPPPTRREVRGLFDSGAGLILHTGHGLPDRWEECFFPRDVERLADTEEIGVVYSASCSTAHFAPLGPYEPYIDVEGKEHAGSAHGEVFTSPPPPPAPYQTGKYNPKCLGERLLTRENSGAVAYIGCNTGSQPCGLTLMAGFVRSLARTSEPRLGDCWIDAVKYYHQRERTSRLEPTGSWYPPSIFFQPMKFMVFADPTLRMPGRIGDTEETTRGNVPPQVGS